MGASGEKELAKEEIAAKGSPLVAAGARLGRTWPVSSKRPAAATPQPPFHPSRALRRLSRRSGPVRGFCARQWRRGGQATGVDGKARRAESPPAGSDPNPQGGRGSGQGQGQIRKEEGGIRRQAARRGQGWQGRSGRGAPKSSAPGWSAGRCKISGALNLQNFANLMKNRTRVSS